MIIISQYCYCMKLANGNISFKSKSIVLELKKSNIHAVRSYLKYKNAISHVCYIPKQNPIFNINTLNLYKT